MYQRWSLLTFHPVSPFAAATGWWKRCVWKTSVTSSESSFAKNPPLGKMWYYSAYAWFVALIQITVWNPSFRCWLCFEQVLPPNTPQQDKGRFSFLHIIGKTIIYCNQKSVLKSYTGLHNAFCPVVTVLLSDCLRLLLPLTFTSSLFFFTIIGINLCNE